MDFQQNFSDDRSIPQMVFPCLAMHCPRAGGGAHRAPCVRAERLPLAAGEAAGVVALVGYLPQFNAWSEPHYAKSVCGYENRNDNFLTIF